MRRYGTFQYGETHYGTGAYDVSYIANVNFTDAFSRNLLVHAEAQHNITFTDSFHSVLVKKVAFQDQITIWDDIRLKYVRAGFSDIVTFSNRVAPQLVNVRRVTDSMTFDDTLYANIIHVTYAVHNIVFSEFLYARHNWEPVPNPHSEIWTPQVSDSDIWVPRVNITDAWTPRELNNG